MKIGYFADGPWAQLALEKILSVPELNISFIVLRYVKPDQVLSKTAAEYGIPCLRCSNANSSEFLEVLKGYGADLFVSMSFDQILKQSIINLPSRGFINCHAGALPFFRGRNVLNWALINGESSFGVTVHFVDEGIDTGDIIIQRHVRININDNYATVLEKAYVNCAEVLLEAILLIYRGDIEVLKQKSIHPVGFYCGRRMEGDEWIDWNWSSKRIYDFIRAISTPGPCARTYYQNKVIAVLEAALIENAPNYIGTAGEVVGVDSSGVVVKTGDSTVKIKQVADLGKNNEPVNIKIPQYRIGTRLGINLFNRVVELEKEIERLKKSR